MTRACENCQWWSDPPPKMPDDRPAGFGVCRGGPPSAPGGGIGQWPVTMAGDWCGAFRMAERLIADRVQQENATADPDEAWRGRRGPTVERVP